jgi:hypothetical protein
MRQPTSLRNANARASTRHAWRESDKRHFSLRIRAKVLGLLALAVLRLEVYGSSSTSWSRSDE